MLAMNDQIDCDISLFIYASIEFIENALKNSNNKAKILIHCYKVIFYLFYIKQGNSRSATVLAGYYIWKRGMTDLNAIEYIRKKRGFIDPNLGFVGQLMDFNSKITAMKQEELIRNQYK